MSFDNKCAVVHTDHRTIPTKYSIVYLISQLKEFKNINNMDNKNNSILTFNQDEALYALISCKNEVWMIGNVLEMLIVKEKYNESPLYILKEHKPFDVVKIDVENSFIKEAKH